MKDRKLRWKRTIEVFLFVMKDGKPSFQKCTMEAFSCHERRETKLEMYHRSVLIRHERRETDETTEYDESALHSGDEDDG